MSTKVSLGLIVLRAANLKKTLRFYEIIGLSFNQEQHGSGPIHFSCELGSIVIEIYPGNEGTAPNYKSGGATMIGLQVESIDAILDRIQQTASIVLTKPQTSTWGRRAVVQDPDGRAIELTEFQYS